MAELYAATRQVDLDPAPGRAGLTAGLGHYASYHALWHLREIGVVPDLKTFESPAWDAAETALATTGRPSRVALIDVSVAYEHPNLRDAILTDLMIDFFSARLGVFPCARPCAEPLVEALAKRSDAETLISTPRTRKLFEELCAYLGRADGGAWSRDWRTPLRIAPATSPAFSAHGTAMAGLIGARPLGPKAVGFAETSHIGPEDREPHPNPPSALGLPYAGVDPFCQIVPISTSFDPDPEQLLLALLYALLIDADVIVLARDFPDPVRTHLARVAQPDCDTPSEAATAAVTAAYPVDIVPEIELWDDLLRLTLDVSQRIPIVCAAGNAGDDILMYPGRLARDDNGIVAVGARAASGLRAGYSSADHPGVTIYAPSGDGERLDTELRRLDTAAPDFRPEDHSARYRDSLRVQHPAAGDRGGGDGAGHDRGSAPGPAPETFATQEIISTDVPGAAGYNASAFARAATATGAVLDYRSYFCHFSGTSAATALVAGVLSLGVAAGKIPRGDPKAAKSRLAPPPTDPVEGAEPFVSWSRLTSSPA